MDSKLPDGRKFWVVPKGEFYLTAKTFWTISDDGKVGYHHDRVPTEIELASILEDIQRSKQYLLNELEEMQQVEAVLRKS